MSDYKRFVIIAIYMTIQFLLLLIINIVTVPVGMILAPLGLYFSVIGKSVSDGRAIDNFPKWLWLWGNDADGTYGDKRLWWDANCDQQVLMGLFPFLRSKGFNVPTLTSKHWLSRYWWVALRNPVNNLRFVPGITCPVNECTIQYFGKEYVSDDLANVGWQLVMATHKTKLFTWFGFYGVWQYPNSKLGLRIRIGFKIKPSDSNITVPTNKGFAVSIIPNKDLT